MSKCAECGMTCDPGEYHPFAACLMFKQCGDTRVVRDNLGAVFMHGRRNVELPRKSKWRQQIGLVSKLQLIRLCRSENGYSLLEARNAVESALTQADDGEAK